MRLVTFLAASLLLSVGVADARARCNGNSCAMPAYRQPAYAAPAYAAPIYAPAYAAPAYAAPVYAAPAYAAPQRCHPGFHPFRPFRGLFRRGRCG